MKDNVTLVLTMARVATKSVYKSLKNNITSDLIYTHHLYKNFSKAPWHGATDTKKSKIFLKYGNCIDDNNKWAGPKTNIISGVRDPVARAISFVSLIGTIDNFSRQVSLCTKAKQPSLENLLFASVEAAMSKDETFDDTAINFFSKRIRGYNTWFNNILNYSFNINAFNYEFNFKESCTYVEDKNRLFIYRVEDLNKRKMIENLNKFLNINLQQISFETTELKFMKKYNQLRQTIKFNNDTLDWFYNTKTVQHFYAPNEIEQFRQNWLG